MLKFLLLLALLGAGIAGYQYFSTPLPLTLLSAEQISTLASTVKAKEVTIYTTSTSPHCAQAMAWLKQNGFAFNECNMSNSSACERAFLQMGGNGTPFLVIKRKGKTYYMRDGFDSAEFLGAL